MVAQHTEKESPLMWQKRLEFKKWRNWSKAEYLENFNDFLISADLYHGANPDRGDPSFLRLLASCIHHNPDMNDTNDKIQKLKTLYSSSFIQHGQDCHKLELATIVDKWLSAWRNFKFISETEFESSYRLDSRILHKSFIHSFALQAILLASTVQDKEIVSNVACLYMFLCARVDDLKKSAHVVDISFFASMVARANPNNFPIGVAFYNSRASHDMNKMVQQYRDMLEATFLREGVSLASVECFERFDFSWTCDNFNSSQEFIDELTYIQIPLSTLDSVDVFDRLKKIFDILNKFLVVADDYNEFDEFREFERTSLKVLTSFYLPPLQEDEFNKLTDNQLDNYRKDWLSQFGVSAQRGFGFKYTKKVDEYQRMFDLHKLDANFYYGNAGDFQDEQENHFIGPYSKLTWVRDMMALGVRCPVYYGVEADEGELARDGQNVHNPKMLRALKHLVQEALVALGKDKVEDVAVVDKTLFIQNIELLSEDNWKSIRDAAQNENNRLEIATLATPELKKSILKAVDRFFDNRRQLAESLAYVTGAAVESGRQAIGLVYARLHELYSRKSTFNIVTDVFVPIYGALLQSANEYGWGSIACAPGSLSMMLGVLQGRIDVGVKDTGILVFSFRLKEKQ